MKRDTARDHLACAMHVIIADRRSLQLTREYLRENYGRPGQNLAQAMDNRYKSPQGLGRLNGPAITRARTHTHRNNRNPPSAVAPLAGPSREFSGIDEGKRAKSKGRDLR